MIMVRCAHTSLFSESALMEFEEEDESSYSLNIFRKKSPVIVKQPNGGHNIFISVDEITTKMDSGLVVVVCIASSMIISVISLLFFVKYEWCHVLFKNNTV